MKLVVKCVPSLGTILHQTKAECSNTQPTHNSIELLYSVSNKESEGDKENFVHCFTSMDTPERPGSFSS